ncbi:hypothetical protein NL676_027568 [Syzygium grande]|nr:hypothetical protein NL676_027568 [Syzygium grande]
MTRPRSSPSLVFPLSSQSHLAASASFPLVPLDRLSNDNASHSPKFDASLSRSRLNSHLLSCSVSCCFSLELDATSRLFSCIKLMLFCPFSCGISRVSPFIFTRLVGSRTPRFLSLRAGKISWRIEKASLGQHASSLLIASRSVLAEYPIISFRQLQWEAY